jgi:hypothetical protein
VVNAIFGFGAIFLEKREGCAIIIRTWQEGFSPVPDDPYLVIRIAPEVLIHPHENGFKGIQRHGLANLLLTYNIAIITVGIAFLGDF